MRDTTFHSFESQQKPHHNGAGTCSVCDVGMFPGTDLANGVSLHVSDRVMELPVPG